MKTTTEALSWLGLNDLDIRVLQHEAATAGDTEMVLTCRTACGDHEVATPAEVAAARKICFRALRAAAALAES
jgi:hypothetical protein